MYDVRVIEEKGDQKFYHNVGVAFDCKDGSLNIKIYTMPGLTLNLKQRPEREGRTNG